MVHHALCRVIAPLIERRMIAQSYACREGLGSHLACRRARELAARHPYFLKLDVRHYFDSIGHDRLIALLAGMFREREVRGILETIIRHPLRGQQKGRGLPIGNLTSQWFANLYLDALDHAVTETLGFGGRYIRYMDDLLVFADTKAEAWAARDFIADWLGRERGLSLKERSSVVAPVSEGVPFLGLRIYPGAWRFSRSRFLRTRRSARRHYRAFLDGRESEAKLQTVVSAMEGAVGWYGFKGILRGVEESSLRTAAGEGDSSNNRVNRGGCYNNDADNCRPSNRNNDNADNANDNIGFRLSSICEPTGGRQDRKSHPARPELRAGCEAEHARHRRTSQRAIPAQRPTSNSFVTKDKENDEN